MPPIAAKCRRLLGPSPTSEDVAQETFLHFWRSSLREAHDPRAVMAWLYRTCTRLAIDVLRHRRFDPVMDTNDLALSIPCAVDLHASAEARAAIFALAQSVPDEELAVAVLCRVDGLSQGETAAVLGIAERTVRRRLTRFDERIGPLRREFSP